MSIEQQPPKSNKIEVRDMPSLDRTVIPPKEHRDDKHEKKLGWKKPAAAVALLGAVAAGAFGGVKALGGGNEVEPRQEPSASASANPGETEPAEPQTDPTAGAVELSVEQYTNGEQLVDGFVEWSNNWQMAGATPALAEDRDRSMSVDEYVQSVNAPIDEAYIDAMLVDGWENDESLRTFVEAMKDNHRIFLNGYIATVLGGDDEPYKYYSSVTSATEESASPDEIVASYRYVGHDNFSEHAGAYISESQEGVTGGSTVTWVKQGDTWKVADVEYNAG